MVSTICGGFVESGKPATLFTDQFRTPAYIPDIAEVIVHLLRAEKFGEIYHCGGSERIDRYEFCAEILCHMRVWTQSGIIACTMDDVPGLHDTSARCFIEQRKTPPQSSAIFLADAPYEKKHFRRCSEKSKIPFSLVLCARYGMDPTIGGTAKKQKVCNFTH